MTIIVASIAFDCLVVFTLSWMKSSRSVEHNAEIDSSRCCLNIFWKLSGTMIRLLHCYLGVMHLACISDGLMN